MRKGLITLIALTLVLLYASPAVWGASIQVVEGLPSSPAGSSEGIPPSVVDNRITQQTALINKPNEYNNVPKNKTWTIVFSEGIDQSDLSDICVSRDPAGVVKVPVLVSFFPQFENMVLVAPDPEWEAGAVYYLLIGDVKSKTGKHLNEKTVIVFTVEKGEPVQQLIDSANSYLVQMKLPEAIQTSEEAAEEAPLDYRGKMLQGMAYMPFDQEKALGELVQSAALNPNDSQLLFLMSFISRTETETGDLELNDKLIINSLY